MKQNLNKRTSRKSKVYSIFSELNRTLGNVYSTAFLYDKAEQIFKLHSSNANFNDGYGRTNTHSRNYFARDVSCIVENDPWLPVYNERFEDRDYSYGCNEFLKELGVR